MRKGDVEIYLMAFILMILLVAIVVSSASGKLTVEEKETKTKETGVCKTDDDCKDIVEGTRCLLIYPGDFVPFCGCLKSEDCKVGNCDSNNKCSS